MLSSMRSTRFHIVQDTWDKLEHYFALFSQLFLRFEYVYIKNNCIFYYFYHIYNGYAVLCLDMQKKNNQTSQIFDLFISIFFSWPSQYCIDFYIFFTAWGMYALSYIVRRRSAAFAFLYKNYIDIKNNISSL